MIVLIGCLAPVLNIRQIEELNLFSHISNLGYTV